MSVRVRPMTEADADGVLEIYRHGIDTGHATFETRSPSWSDWDRDHLRGCRLVAERDEVVGWAALAGVSGRCVYAGVAEVSVYVHRDARGAGVGRALLAALIEASEAAGIWTLQAGIFPENVASIGLHEALGFRRLGVHERLGRMGYGPMAGEWRDVLRLERRSRLVGT